jgi:hypothetical protein
MLFMHQPRRDDLCCLHQRGKFLIGDHDLVMVLVDGEPRSLE